MDIMQNFQSGGRSKDEAGHNANKKQQHNKGETSTTINYSNNISTKEEQEKEL